MMMSQLILVFFEVENHLQVGHRRHGISLVSKYVQACERDSTRVVDPHAKKPPGERQYQSGTVAMGVPL